MGGMVMVGEVVMMVGEVVMDVGCGSDGCGVW